MGGSAPRRRLSILIVGLLAGLAGMILGYLASRDATPTRSSETENPVSPGGIDTGTPVPDFELADLDGRPTRFSKLSGKPVVVNFWATWCPPCLREMPLLQSLHEQGEVLVLGINAGEPVEVVGAYLESRGIAYPVWIDPPGTTPPGRASMDLFRRFGGIGLPLTLFIDARGVFRAVHNGELDEPTLEHNVATIRGPATSGE